MAGFFCFPRFPRDRPESHYHVGFQVSFMQLYAIRKPIQDSKFSDSAYRGFRYIPNSCSGLRWSLVDESGSDVSSNGSLMQKQFDGFYGWRGLVAYMTKGIFSNEDLSKYMCGETYARLNRLPVSPQSSLAELLE